MKPMSNLYEAVMDALQARDDIERRIRETLAKMQSMKYEDELERQIKTIIEGSKSND